MQLLCPHCVGRQLGLRVQKTAIEGLMALLGTFSSIQDVLAAMQWV